MKSTGPILERWSQRARGEGGLEDRVGDLFRRVKVPVRFDDAGAAAIAPSPRRTFARARWFPAVAALLVLGSGGAVIAAKGLPRRWIAAITAVEITPADPGSPAHRSKKRARAVSPPVTTDVAVASPPLSVPAVVPAPIVEASPPPAPARPARRQTVALVTNSAPTPPEERIEPPPVESRLFQESRLLQEAMGRLRRGGDAAGALVALDAYRAQFGEGLLTKEAAMIRADALLALGRSTDALDALEKIPLGAGAREQELRLIRGELRAARDCARAEEDFDQVLRSSVRGALEERALYGRARCQLQVGQRSEAEKALRLYLARYPAGRFADEARRLIGP